MTGVLAAYFRCATDLPDPVCDAPGSSDAGYFYFGPRALCFGRTSHAQPSPSPELISYDAAKDMFLEKSSVRLPFDPEEVVHNLQNERYARTEATFGKMLAEKFLRRIYYSFRPALPLKFRRRLQKWYLGSWRELRFPNWPVDTSVNQLMRELLRVAMKSKSLREVPFIWFWPQGANGCVIMTHDVESEIGVKLTPWIMDIDESFRIPASFQIVPEDRYSVTPEFLDAFSRRGFEVNVQDLNHDGMLFSSKELFKKRVCKVGQYAKRYGARGFRAAVLYRNQEWYNLLPFEYDMSVPNSAHLDPQRGGCCTVLPYFIGDIVELPVTTTQDYSLFYILDRYDLNLWREQVSLVLEHNGLVSFIIHPDYMQGAREKQVYENLLQMIVELKREQNVWLASPGEVSAWWRQRSQMAMREENGNWFVEGEGSEWASVAFATLQNDRLTFRVKTQELEFSTSPGSVAVNTRMLKGPAKSC